MSYTVTRIYRLCCRRIECTICHERYRHANTPLIRCRCRRHVDADAFLLMFLRAADTTLLSSFDFADDAMPDAAAFRYAD